MISEVGHSGFELPNYIENTERRIDIPRGIDAMLEEHRARKEEESKTREVRKLEFDLSDHPDWVMKTITSEFEEPTEDQTEGESGNKSRLAEVITAYNPSSFRGETGVVRVEHLKDEYSGVVGFTERNGVLVPDSTLFNAEMAQDPSISYNEDGPNFLTYVGIKTDNSGKIINWQQYFFPFKNSLAEVGEPCAKGPEKMKDIRMKQLPDGKWAVFTRPQGPTPEQGGLGKIGYIEIDTWEELEEGITKAPLIPDVFREGEWGGVNDIIPLNNDKIGLLSHIARKNPNGSGEKEYYSMLMIYSREQGRVISQRIILEAADLPYEVKGKRPDLKNVVFSGGAIQLADGRLKISGGSGDTEAFEAIIDAPELLRAAQGRD